MNRPNSKAGGFVPGTRVEVSGQGAGVIISAPSIPQSDLLPEYVVKVPASGPPRLARLRDLKKVDLPRASPAGRKRLPRRTQRPGGETI